MSNALAIATVTDTLFNVLSKALAASLIGNAQVTVLRPNDAAFHGTSVTPGVNIFLYQVTPNPAWRNADLPTRRSDGSPLRRPQLALDLHYLFTFYGTDTDYQQQRLLGVVARALHAQPTLARSDIAKSEQKPDPADNKTLYLDSKLSDQVDLVRFTPINFSLEELSKLWSVFLKIDYVLSVAYVATIVLIETDDLPPATALPVLEARIDAVPFSLTAIETIDPQYVEELSPPATAVLTLSGQSLAGADEAAFTTPGVAAPIKGSILGPGAEPGQLRVELPPGLHPGVNTVALLRFLPAESPLGIPRVFSQSNAAAFVLRPTVQNVVVSAPGKIRAAVSPLVGPGQKASLLLNQLTASPPGQPLALELPALARTAETGSLDFDTSFQPPGAGSPVSVPGGTYLARVRIDGAESRLASGSGGFSGPKVTLP